MVINSRVKKNLPNIEMLRQVSKNPCLLKKNIYAGWWSTDETLRKLCPVLGLESLLTFIVILLKVILLVTKSK